MLPLWFACIEEPPPPPVMPPPATPLPATADWQRLSPALSGSTLLDIDGDGDLGFAVGARGTVLRTTDGGQTWAALPAPVDATLRSVAVRGDAAWIGGHGALLHTEDRGQTWARVPVDDAVLVDLDLTPGGAIAVTAGGDLLALTAAGVQLTLPDLDLSAAAVFAEGWLLMAPDRLLWMTPESVLATVYPVESGSTLVDLAVSGSDIDLLVRRRDEHSDTDWVHFRFPEAPAARWWPDAVTPIKTRLIATRTLARGPDWLAIAGDGHDSWRSTDSGQTWQRTWGKADLSSNTALHTRALWAAPSGLIAAADTALLRSPDGGASWSVVDARPVDFLWGGDIDDDGSLWLAAPHTVVRSDPWRRIGPMVESLSGAQVPLGILGGSLDALLTGDGAVVVAGSRGMWRGQGDRWRHAHDGGRFRKLARLSDGLIAVGTVAMRSTDGGRSWRTVSTQWAHEVWGLGHHGQTLWGVGDYGFTVSSEDGGRTWQAQTAAEVDHLAGVAVSPDAVIAAGSGGAIVRRTVTGWQALGSGTTHDLRAVWHDRKTDTWVVVGEAGTALTSADGQTWAATDTGTDQGLWGLLGDHSGRVVAVGTGGIVLQLSL